MGSATHLVPKEWKHCKGRHLGVSTYMCVYLYKHVCMHLCVHIHIYMCVRACMHAFVFMCTDIHILPEQ